MMDSVPLLNSQGLILWQAKSDDFTLGVKSIQVDVSDDSERI